MTEYIEPTKIEAREQVLKAAIQTLTLDRNHATLARRSYVREVRDYILNCNNSYDQAHANKLSDNVIAKWEYFYDSITQSKNASNLKVAYLSGPNPENDLKVFTSAGILPENIWAFESENKTYTSAVVSALNSEYPFIKLVNGGIDTFLEASPQKFDIIYLDFCGPLPNRDKKQKTLGAITKILAQHALNSPGVLITNVSLPTQEQDSVGRKLLSKLVASYLYPKDFLECKDSDSGMTEGAISNGFDLNEWLEEVESNLDNYYGQFVTRLLMDHASFISPYDRFPRNSSLFKKFFDIKDKSSLSNCIASIFHFDDDCNGGDVIVDAGVWSIPWAFAALDKNLNAHDINYPQWIFEDDNFSKFADQFISQLNIQSDKKELIDGISMLSYLISEGAEEEQFLSEGLSKIGSNHSIRNYYQFCDVVLFHQIKELLFRQVAVPYHVNVEKTRRWKYKAKSTVMYVDMLVMDECRYLYDWMPTADMLSAGMTNIERQLAYRFALDGVAKHRRWYNNEYFFGTAVVDQDTEPFEAKTLKLRETLGSSSNKSTR
jgi:hypothetical protein